MALIIFTPLANSIVSIHALLVLLLPCALFLPVAEYVFLLSRSLNWQRARSEEGCSSLDGSSCEESQNTERNYRVPRVAEQSRSTASQKKATPYQYGVLLGTKITGDTRNQMKHVVSGHTMVLHTSQHIRK